jgi:cytochrome c peroxidase
MGSGWTLGQAEPPADPLMMQARQLFEPIPHEPPNLEGNPDSPEKETLGHALFFDPRLSGSWAISCNSCHNMGMAGVDLQPTSIGHGWQRGGRNSPTVLNAVFNLAQFWDGRAEDLAIQALGPPPYFHSGSVWELEDAVAIMGTAQLGTALTDDEVRSITAFLHTLTGMQPVVTHPVLPPITEFTPLPTPGHRP